MQFVSYLQLKRYTAIISLSKRVVVDVDHYCECLCLKGTSDIYREQYDIYYLYNCMIVMLSHSIVL